MSYYCVRCFRFSTYPCQCGRRHGVPGSPRRTYVPGKGWARKPRRLMYSKPKRSKAERVRSYLLVQIEALRKKNYELRRPALKEISNLGAVPYDTIEEMAHYRCPICFCKGGFHYFSCPEVGIGL